MVGSLVLFMVVVVSVAESDIDLDLRDHGTSDTRFHSSLFIHSFDILLSSFCANLLLYFASPLVLPLIFFSPRSKTEDSVDKKRSDTQTMELICVKNVAADKQSKPRKKTKGLAHLSNEFIKKYAAYIATRKSLLGRFNTS